MSETELNTYLKTTKMTSFTPYTLVNEKSIRKELEKIWEQSYSVDNEEMEEGVRCVAALIRDHAGNPAAAVSISGAALRITTDRIADIGRLLKECTTEISRQLGFHNEKRNRS